MSQQWHKTEVTLGTAVSELTEDQNLVFFFSIIAILLPLI